MTLRRFKDLAAHALCLGCVLLALAPLGSLLATLVAKGAPGLDLALFTQLPRPLGEPGGGMAHAFAGSLLVLGLAALLGLPVGILGGVHLAEHGRTRLARAARFCADVLSGAPSIVLGILVYTLLVVPMRRFSALAGGAALALLMLPTVMRTTEEILRMVPVTLREAGLALGLPRWRVVLGVVLRTGGPGILTGVMLALARAAGETAPLLFTAFGSLYMPSGLDQPAPTLPVQIYTYAVSPFEAWHRQAWAAALALVLLILLLNVLARIFTRPLDPGR